MSRTTRGQRLLVLLLTFSVVLLAGVGPQNALAAASASGKTYYVSPGGNDENEGTSLTRPLRTVQACAQLAQPGDTCYLLSGTYRESVHPLRSGTADRPITYAAFPDAEVRFDGADLVNGWTQVTGQDVDTLAQSNPYVQNSGFSQAVAAGHIYKASVATNPDLFANQLFVNGQMVTEARWPDAGNDIMTPTFPTFATAKEGSDYDHINDSALTQPDGFWNGAMVYLTYWFVTKTMTVSDYTTGHFTVTGSFDCGNVTLSTRYYLSGQIAALDHPGEWFYDKGTQTLYFWTPDSSDPAQNTIELKQRQTAFDLSGHSFIQIKGINLFGTTIMTNAASDGITIDRLHANYVSHFTSIPVPQNLPENDECNVLVAHEQDTGIVIAGTHSVIKNSVIENSAGNGVALLGSFNKAENNFIRNIDYAGNYTAGIYVQGHDQQILHNTISRVGRSDISVDFHNNGFQFFNNRIAYNDISQYGMIQTDVGAFYACCELDMSGTRLDHNWAHDIDRTYRPIGTIVGLFLDNSSGHALLDHNVLWGNDFPDPTGINEAGIALQFNSASNQVYNNTISTNQQKASIAFVGSNQTGLDNHVVNNILSRPLDYVPSDLDQHHNVLPDVDPKFIDLAHNNYLLQPDSPAIDAGQVIPGITDGYAGSAPDIGAYESGKRPWRVGCTLPECRSSQGS